MVCIGFMTDTRERILIAGRELIMSRGYNGFSYADIVDLLKIGKATVHHHFPAKADLARAVVGQSRAAIADRAALLRREQPDPVEQLEGYAGYWERCINDGSAPFCVAAMLAAELPSLPPELAADVTAHFNELASWLEHLLHLGAVAGALELRSAPRVEADSFMATIYGAMLAARAHTDPGLFAAITQHAFEGLLTKRRTYSSSSISSAGTLS
jgi:TetR/AcrR family transcriptional repressor of nem operon